MNAGTCKSSVWRCALIGAVVAVGCSARTSDPWLFGSDDDGGNREGVEASAEDATVLDVATVDAPPLRLDLDASNGLPKGCAFSDGKDHDGDGFSFMEGDCNDCDPNMNPGAFDVPNNGVDEDCDGTADDEPSGCDANLALDSSDPYDGARAIDLCRKTTSSATGKARTWGVVDAKFVAPDGTDQCFEQPAFLSDGGASSCAADPNFALGHGNLAKLGVVTPRVGTHMLGISSGTARDPTDPGYSNVSGYNKGFMVNAAPGFPAPSPACPGVIAGQPHDGAALSLTIRVPTNARSFSLNEDFFSYEFPHYICSAYNDTFVVEMTPPPISSGANIAFDQAGNPICVNNSLLQVCDPQTAGGKTFACPLGSSSLQGTGFGGDPDAGSEGHAATGWLTTTVNIDPSLLGKEMTLLFAIWDSGDGSLDSTALLDGLTWSTQPGKSTPVTEPSPPR